MKITDILQYSIKGLGPNKLNQAALTVGAGMPADRLFAITHGNSAFSFEQPRWIDRRHFAVMAHSPQLGPVDCEFDVTSQTLKLIHNGTTLLNADINDKHFNDQLDKAIAGVISTGQPGPYKLARAGNTRLTDIPSPTISIMNTKSLSTLENAIGHALDKQRFRANVWFDGDSAWQEHDWVGKPIQIGEVKLYVTERIQRCTAIDANPELGARDINVLKQLHQNFGHSDFGVLAQVDVEGTIRVDDMLTA